MPQEIFLLAIEQNPKWVVLERIKILCQSQLELKKYLAHDDVEKETHDLSIEDAHFKMADNLKVCEAK